MTLIPTQINFRGLAHSETIEADIHERIAWLEQFYGGIVRCRVLVEIPHRHRHDGRHFQVGIDITVPGGAPIVVSHEPSLHGPMKDIDEAEHHKDTEVDAVHRYAHVAIHEAFDVARRQLQDFAREQRGVVKTHEVPEHGEIAEISAVEGHGFIRAGERQIYFTRASVLDEAFDELEVGTAIAFVEEKGEKGPQASTVRVLGKHHYVTH
jgi:cold shock CspA family protein/ribosome-associated translation inhibitor RaiA